MGFCFSLCCGDEEEEKKQQQKKKQDSSHSEPLAPGASSSSSNNQKKQEKGPALGTSAHSKIVKKICSHVYDGDTAYATEDDIEPRIRFRWNDSPERKAKEPYAEESKDFCKKYLKKGTEMWLEVDDREERDRYNRWLANIWIEDPEGSGEKICVNDLMLSSGFSCFYEPGGKTDFVPNEERRAHMLKLQAEALRERRGIWTDFSDSQVYHTRNGHAYHTKDCEHVCDYHLTESKKSVCISEKGMSSCRTCHA